jgi:uncharacterized protein
MRIVLDTNVLVSGLLTPFGTCGKIVRMLTSAEIMLCVDARILLEYEEVLRRPKFTIEPQKVDAVMVYVQGAAETYGCEPLPVALPDEDDSPFLEVALAAGADCLVTGNVRHYPKECRFEMPVLSPIEFIEAIRKR